MSVHETSSPASAGEVRALFGGDLMLGRNVKEYILRHGPSYPLGPIADMMRSADLTVVNLECAITRATERWSGAPKAFYFGAPPQACETLTDAGIDLVSLANNHVLDYGYVGLHDTLRFLDQDGVAHAGAGEDLHAALTPAIVERCGIRFGMVAFCDHQDDFAAQDHSGGIAYLNLADEEQAVRAFRAALRPLHAAGVDWPILSLHWGPNMVFRPSASFRRLAHAAVTMGWRMLFGHSAHVFHGVEIFRGCPIVYAAGDLVDDYVVDDEFRNDLQLLFEIRFSRIGIRGIRMHPISIDECRAVPADGVKRSTIAHWFARVCAELGTDVDPDRMEIRLAH